MRTGNVRIRLALGSLAGAIAVHVVMVACTTMGSGPSGSDGGADGGNDAAASGDRGGIVDALISALPDAVGDVARATLDAEVRDASAQNCATCTSAGAARVITADTDATRFVHATVERGFGPSRVVVAGPAVLQDVGLTCSAASCRLFIFAGTACPPDGGGDGDTIVAARDNGSVFQSGRRIGVRAGESVCISSNSGGTASYFGFRPYDSP
jgi:hypothetical protein